MGTKYSSTKTDEIRTNNRTHKDLLQHQKNTERPNNRTQNDLPQNQKNTDRTNSRTQHDLPRNQKSTERTNSRTQNDLPQNQKSNERTNSKTNNDILQNQRSTERTHSNTHNDLVQSQNSTKRTNSITQNDLLINQKSIEKRNEQEQSSSPCSLMTKTQSIKTVENTNSQTFEHSESKQLTLRNVTERTKRQSPELNSEHIVKQGKHDFEGRQRQCAICFEGAFKNPKLLPCSHTFCLPCLQDHLKCSFPKETLVCPLCRADVFVPEQGVKELLENYFVSTAKATICDTCRDFDSKIKCDSCEKTLCHNCIMSHRCKRTGPEHAHNSLFNFDDSGSESDDSDIESPRRLLESDVPVLFTRPNRPWTKLLFNEGTNFRIPDHESIFIAPVSENNAWMITISAGNTSLLLVDTNGTVQNTIPLPSKAVCFAVEHSESILIPFPEKGVVCRFHNGEFTTIVRPCMFHPTAVAIYPNGEFLVAGFHKSNMEDNTHGQVKLFSGNGSERSDFSTGTNVIPTCICIIDNDLICLAYPDNHFIDIRFKNGQIVDRYMGTNTDTEEGESFNPLSICAGRFGNFSCIFISDSYCDVIHVISQTGKFIGLAMISGNDMGEPGCLGFNERGKLWVGQADDEVISIYDTSICKYSNVMEEEDLND